MNERILSPDAYLEMKRALSACQTGAHVWPRVLGLTVDSSMDSGYYALPYLFAPAFPDLSLEEIRPLATFCRLYAQSILIADNILDDAPTGLRLQQLSLRLMALQFDAYRILHPVFPPDAAFWDLFRTYLGEYANGCLEESAFVFGDRPWSEYDEATGLRIVISKNGIARVIIAGLVELSGRREALEPLCRALDGFNVAFQMWDDIRDWKADLRQCIPSLLVVRLCPERPVWQSEDDFLARTKQLTAQLYYSGHLRHVLGVALRGLARASTVEPQSSDHPWHRQIGNMKTLLANVERNVDEIVNRNISRARGVDFCVTFPHCENAARGTAYRAATFLVDEWRRDFGEGRILVCHPWHAPGECYEGDVFPRAMVLDALCDLPPEERIALIPVFEQETKYLINTRCTTQTGGWVYYLNSTDLPPDADSLAQMLQAIWRADQCENISEFVEPPLHVLLRDGLHNDGSIETWIIPAEGRRSALEEEHARLCKKRWQTGPDPEVVANLLYALHLWDAQRFQDVIEYGTNWVEQQQNRDGTWSTRRYLGPYYGIHVAVRLLAVKRPNSPCIPRALDFLRRQTNLGRFSFNRDQVSGDVLATALALLAFAEGATSASEQQDHDIVDSGLDFLRRSSLEGNYPRHSFIVDGSRAHGSRTLTAVFVLKAASAWAAKGFNERVEAA